VDGGKRFSKENDEQFRAEFLIKTKLALRPRNVGTSRPRRQGSVDERPGKNRRTALDPAPGSPRLSVVVNAHLPA